MKVGAGRLKIDTFNDDDYDYDDVEEKDGDRDDSSAQCGQDGNKVVKVGAGRLKIDKSLEEEEEYGAKVVGGFDEESGNENSVMRPRCDLELDGSKFGAGWLKINNLF